MLLGFPDYARQAEALAAALGERCHTVAVHRFPDGESKITLPATLTPEVIFCRSLDHPNGKLIELLLASATAREHGAARVTLVAPYLCYMRQDMAFSAGEAVSQRIIGRFLAAHFDRVVTVDPHLHRVHDIAAAVPAASATALSAATPIARFLASRLDAPLLLGPDAESQPWVRRIATEAGFDWAAGTKVRHGDRHVTVTFDDVAMRGREVVLVDDVASTGRTLARAAEQCRQRGAARVAIVVTHALFVGDAVAHLEAAGVSAIWSTDSVRHDSNAIALAPLLADALAPSPSN